jgi:hypothetical protein
MRAEIEIKNLDHLGLVAGLIDKLEIESVAKVIGQVIHLFVGKVRFITVLPPILVPPHEY